jgi:hypothetical protein
MPNQVTLTFGGDPSGAQKAFGSVGDSAKKMQDQVGNTSEGFNRAGEAADGAESKAQGFSDTLTGTADVATGFGQIMKGDLFGGFVMVGQGAADLAGGFADFLIPALAKTKIATLAQAAASKTVAAATKVWDFAQKMFNITLLTSPLTWVVLAIAAIVVIIVLIATKTKWFQNIWKVAWSGIKSAASNTWEFLKKIPGWIQVAFAKVAGFITAPYRAAFNGIARLWNSTVGRLSFQIPGWVPGIGGSGFSVPHIPTLHSGGIVPGTYGQVVPILAMGGERVSSGASPGGTTMISAGDALTRQIFKLVRDEVIARGGDPSAIGLNIA